MGILKILGALCIGTAVACIINRKKQKKGERTWEGDHNIDIQGWWAPLLIVIGIIMLMSCSYMANYEEYVSPLTKNTNTIEDTAVDLNDYENVQTEDSMNKKLKER